MFASRRVSRFALIMAAAGLSLWTQTASAQKTPEQTVDSMQTVDGLQTTLWASEPGTVKPTNMDIDERGRIWITEAANYRGAKRRPDGDRIMILEDTKHTGVCDSYKVFVQDKKLFAPLGICKLGNKLYVAQSPNVFIYTIDESGDKPVGEPVVLFTGFGGTNHDHGVHAGLFGPDGRYYFNCGNEGGRGLVTSADGKPVIDRLGSEVGSNAKIYRGQPKPKGFLGYREGLALSCGLDGSDFMVLGYNFRNNYELTVDSFGTVWQSDNDDDGNQGVRINYVMEGGDFGYTGPKGSNWSRDMGLFPGQTKQEAHWHQRFPGIVPNLLNTGAGAPCGILIYEGDLLPEPYHGALLHCDAGRNVVRAYVTHASAAVPTNIFKSADPTAVKPGSDEEKSGAGYQADAIEMVKLKNGGDTWFRPADICVAPDGAVYVCDWYDPGVGGHATGDKLPNLHGRVYRIVPRGYQPSEVKLDLATVPGQIAALSSPNLSTRYLGYTKLAAGGDDAVKALEQLYTSSKNPRLRARALWLLARSKEGSKFVEQAMKDPDVDIRVTALRAARAIKMDMIKVAGQMIGDPHPFVWRELCLAMNYEPTDKALPVLVKLGDKYDGSDRWYLEAFGIGCTGREAEVLAAWQKDHTNNEPKVAEGISWRLKMQATPGSAADASFKKSPVSSWWALAAFATEGDALAHNYGPDKAPGTIDLKAEYKGADGKAVKWEQINATDGPEAGYKQVDFVELCKSHGQPVASVVGYFAASIVATADQKANLLVNSDDGVKIWLNGKEVFSVDETRAIGVDTDTVPVQLHKGRNVLLCKLRQGDGASGLCITVSAKEQVAISNDLGSGDRADASASPSTGSANSYPLPPTADATKQFKTRDGQILPPIGELMALTGDPAAGEAVFKNAKGANCIHCHQVGEEGNMIGPPLTVIGSKLNKGQLYEAILYPSASILMHYETWVVKTKAGDVVSGLLVEDTPDHLTLKDSDGKYHDVPTDDVAKKVMQKVSLMPEGLAEAMTKPDLVNLVEFLTAHKAQ